MPTRGTEKRKATCLVRCTPRAKKRLGSLAKKHGLPLSETLEAILTWHLGKCRNCGATCLHPTERHRWHDPACVLYADRDHREKK